MDSNSSYYAAGIRIGQWSHVKVQGCRLSNNGTAGQIAFIGGLGDPVQTYYVPGLGGGIGIVESIAEIDSCVLEGNTSDEGAGISLYRGECLMRNSLLVSGSGTKGVGVIATEGVLSITHCTLAGNRAEANGAAGSPEGAGLLVHDLRDTKIENTILVNEGPNEIVGEVFVSYSNIKGGWTGPGNIDADPKFLDIGIGDFRLAADSPCIDTGTRTELLTDLEGNPRPVDIPGVGRDGTGDEFDMGAYEVPLGGFPTWTPTPTPTLTPSLTPTLMFDEFTDGRIDARDLLELFNSGKADEESVGMPTLFHFSLYWRAVETR